MPEPTMVNLTTQNRFVFKFTGGYFFKSAFELMVTDITLPGLSGGITEQPAPHRPIPRPGTKLEFDDLVLTFLVSEDYTEWKEMFNWIRSINLASDISMSENVSQGVLFITTNKFNSNFSLTFDNVFPYNLSTIDLSLEMTSNDPIKTSASFKYTDYRLT